MVAVSRKTTTLTRPEAGHEVLAAVLCKNKNKLVVEYALRHLTRPVGVAESETELLEKLPKELEGSLPTIEQFDAEFSPKRGPR